MVLGFISEIGHWDQRLMENPEELFLVTKHGCI
jgi:hypothetical protein